MKFVIRLLLFIGIALLQVLVLSHIQWLGVATPYLYIYFILLLDSSTSRSELLLWSFAMGLIVDLFGNTLGVHAAAATLLACLRPSLLGAFMTREDIGPYEPGLRLMGLAPFWHYTLTSTALCLLVVFVLLYFNLSMPLQMLMHIVASTLLTVVTIMGIELVRNHRM